MLWGIDLGGTKIEGVVIDSLESKEVLARERTPTEQQRGYEAILEKIDMLITELIRKVGDRPSRIGFATPGVIDSETQLLKNSNTQCLNGRPLVKDLQNKLKAEIELQNDANCFALAETLWGSASGKEVVFGIIMGTGVGGGLVLNGKARNGHQGIAGEWGHNSIVPDGPYCYCGKRGCVETLLSGTALERWYEAQAGEKRLLQEIYQRHLAKIDSQATRTIERLNTYFGQAVAGIINILDPDAIVIGGGVSNLPCLYQDGVSEVLKNVFNHTPRAPIMKNVLGDSAGVFGAAFLTV